MAASLHEHDVEAHGGSVITLIVHCIQWLMGAMAAGCLPPPLPHTGHFACV